MGQIGLWFGLVRMLTMALDPGFCASIFLGKWYVSGEWILVGMGPAQKSVGNVG